MLPLSMGPCCAIPRGSTLSLAITSTPRQTFPFPWLATNIQTTNSPMCTLFLWAVPSSNFLLPISNHSAQQSPCRATMSPLCSVVEAEKLLLHGRAMQQATRVSHSQLSITITLPDHLRLQAMSASLQPDLLQRASVVVRLLRRVRHWAFHGWALSFSLWAVVSYLLSLPLLFLHE